jgi:PPOX class probable F420-dependent enzyme
MGLADEKYVAFTTFKRDGTPVTTPVWVVGLEGGKLGFWTSSGSGKAKRLRNNPKVTVQPCNGRGKLTEGTTPTDGTAVTATSGPEVDEIQPKIKAKYGVMVSVTKLFNKIGALVKRKQQPYGDTGVVITLT